MSEPHGEAIRFADVLTTASAVANYLGESDVSPAHLLDAIAILLREKGMDELGRPTSPLVRRPAPPGATAEARDVVQRWFEALGGDANASLDADAIARLRADLAT